MKIENESKRPMLILTGPTAAGKTALSIALAKRIGGEIISADSMQIYKKMNIGSAKIRPKEMEGIPHYLVDELDPKEEFNVVLFQQRAKKALSAKSADTSMKATNCRRIISAPYANIPRQTLSR